MCGIFLYSSKKKQELNILKKLILNSQKRGLDNIGLVFIHDKIEIIKKSYGESIFKDQSFKNLLNKKNEIIFGQCRLVTDGARFNQEFNQPIIYKNFIGTHNGIIIDYVKDSYSENINSSNDTFLFYKDLNEVFEKASFKDLSKFLLSKKGIINIVYYSIKENKIYIFSNNGSLFFIKDNDTFIIASEKNFLINIKIKKDIDIQKFNLNTLYEFKYDNFVLKEQVEEFLISGNEKKLVFINKNDSDNLKKCTLCILPTTYPLIKFDENNICNYCNSYEKQKYAGVNSLTKLLGSTQNKILYGLSGGVDSSYGLHFLIKDLGYKNIVTYTYDWGLTTDISRRNISLMSSKLGVENILRTANIPQKRKYIRNNILAWLKKPHLGMVPLFFIGDKPFLYYGTQIKKEINAHCTVHATGVQFEQMEFKVAYCGIDQKLKNNQRMFDFNLSNKIKLFFWYLSQFIKNPFYINSSFLDNLVGFYSSFIHRDQAIHLYNYVEYDQKKINSILENEYGFLKDLKYGKNQWRVGDGQTAFTNFIYYTLGGFSEFDNYRSNQVREGYISRDEAILLAKEDNNPRIETIDNFCKIIGLNTEEILGKILRIKRKF